MSDQPSTCPHCGKPASQQLLGMCPECMLKAGLNSVTGEGTVPDSPGRFVPPTVQELGRYFPQLEILELIGRGGMGAVYKARQKQLDRIVALKILPPGIGAENAEVRMQNAEREDAGATAFADRFTREAKALAALAHPNIVTLYEFGQTDGLFFFLMEFVDGVNLRQLLSGGKLAPKEALAIVPHICDALQYAHDRGIVHRDIKPENILLSRDGVVKIADFGVAKILGRSDAATKRRSDEGEKQVTQPGAVGTPAYMAPEQVDRPAEVDHRADIYSLGVVLYQMLTGELPGKQMEPPSRKVQIDVRIDEIVMRALEHNPEMRYSQASVFKTEVQTVAATSAETPSAQAQRAINTDTTLQFGEGPSIRKWQLNKSIPIGERLSRTAVVGAAWAPFAFIAFVLAFVAVGPVAVPAGSAPSGPSWWQILLMLVVGGLGIAAPFGTTILGWIAVSQIRHSAGRLYGLALAVFDAMCFPLLVLDAVIMWCVQRLMVLLFTGPYPGHFDLAIFLTTANWALLLGVVGSLCVDWLIIRRVWRAVTGVKPATRVPDRGLARQAILLLGGGILLCAAVLAAWRMVHHPTQISTLPASSSRSSSPISGSFPHDYASSFIVHDNVDLHYAIFYAGSLNTSPGGSHNTHSLTWIDKGSLKLKSGRTFGYLRESVNEFFLDVNGQEYDLRQGRVLVLHDDGTVKQIKLFPPLSTASNPETLARLIPSTQSLYEGLADLPKLQGQLEIAQSQLRDLLKTHAPTHKLVMEVQQSIRTLEQKINEMRPSASGSPSQQPPSAAFGPALSQVIHDLDEGAGDEALNLEAGKLFNMTRDIGRLPAAKRNEWLNDNGIDLLADYARNRWALMVNGLKLATITNDGWEKATPDDLQAALDGRDTTLEVIQGPGETFLLLPQAATPPLTFALETRSGRRGILQIAALTDKPRGLAVRYKLVQQPATKPSASGATEATFGPEIARIVNHTGDNCLIDLDTGEVTTPPKSVFAEGAKAAIRWTEQHGIDAGGLVDDADRGLIGFDMVVMPVSDKSWEGVAPYSLREMVALSKPGNPVYLLAGITLPRTFLFATREGGMGVLQITGFTDNPKGVKIRYKLLQQPSTTLPVAKTAD